MSRVSVVRESIVRIVRMLTEKKITVTQRGSTAFVSYNPDGSPNIVNIPYIPETVSEELLMATQGFLDHEVAHVLFTDFKALVVAKNEGMAMLHNIVEDAFIERKMAGAFAGSSLNLRNVGEYFLREYTDKRLAEDPFAADGLLIVPAIRAWSGQLVFQEYMKTKWHLIEKIVSRIGVVAAAELPGIKNSMEAVDVTRKLKKLLEHEEEVAAPPAPKRERAPKPDKAPKDERKAGEKPKKSKGCDSTPAPDPEGGDEDLGITAESSGDADSSEGSSGKSSDSESDDGAAESKVEEVEGSDDLDDDEDEPHASDDGEEDEEDEEDEEGEEGEDGGEISGDSSSSAGGSGDGSTHSASGDIYKALEESVKDFDEELAKMISAEAAKEAESTPYLIYSRDFDVIENMPIPETRWDDSYLQKMQNEVDHMVGPLQKDFERAIAAKSASTWSTGHRSGRLHPTALSRLQFGDDRVFRRRHINNGKDVAVSLMIDCSGSMGCAGKIKVAAYTAYGLSLVLDRMNISNEVIGFTTKKSMGRESYEEEGRAGKRYARTLGLYMPIFKGYSERMTPETKKRFAYLPHSTILAENVDGECVEIAATRLAQRKEGRKILIVISDGEPACPGDSEALDKHLKQTVAKVERAGVEVLGIGIQSSAAARYYPKHVLLTELADLPTQVIAEIKKILMK